MLVWILVVAEGYGLIAKKDPPRLCWPSASCRQGAIRWLGDPEAKHEKLAMDPWHTSEKVLTVWLPKTLNAPNSLEFLDSLTQYRQHEYERAIDRFSACWPIP